eukprot:scaffold124406_cov32-Tisochrysis_lutea.AAC.4
MEVASRGTAAFDPIRVSVEARLKRSFSADEAWSSLLGDGDGVKRNKILESVQDPLGIDALPPLPVSRLLPSQVGSLLCLAHPAPPISTRGLPGPPFPRQGTKRETPLSQRQEPPGREKSRVEL